MRPKKVPRLTNLPSTLYITGSGKPIKTQVLRSESNRPPIRNQALPADDYEIELISQRNLSTRDQNSDVTIDIPSPLISLRTLSAMDEDNDVVIDMSRPSAPMAMIALLQNCADKEKTFWASKYQDDLAFRTKIDNFVTFQALAIKLKDEEKVPPAELDQAFCNLGSMLADAFGMVDPLTGKWSKPTQEACARAGAEYSRASVWAFAYAQAPGMARSMLNLLGQAAVGLGAPPLVATVVQHLTGFTASIAQLPVSMLATQWNADQQSDCVQQMKGKNPEFVPNVISTKIVKPDGTSVELRPLSHVQEDLNDLDWVSKLLDSGTEADLTSASLLYSGKIDEADARLLKQLSKATAKLGTLQQQGRALNAIEIELKNPKRDQRERAELLSKVSRGPTALPGPLKLETKRCLEQINHWELLVKDLDAARDALKAQRLAKLESAKKDLVDDGNGFAGDIESSMSDYSDSNETTPVATNAAPDPRPVLKSDALRKVHSDRAFEQIQILQYRAMNVLTNQSYSRWVRSWLFVTGASGQLILQLAQHIAGKDLGPASDVWQLATSLAQTIIYAWQQPKMSGEDYLNKLATQWNIVAMTGTGSFVDKAGKVVPSKLDAAVTGPLLTRLTTFASILIFDRSVYTQSILGWVVDPHTLDDEAAIAAVLELPTKDKNGKAVKDEDGNLVMVPRLVPCTYLSLAAEFHSLPDRSYRKRFVIELIEKLEIGEEIGSSMLRNLECYEDNEANIASAKSGDLNSLLSKLISSSEAGLLPETIELFGCFVLSQSPPDAIEHDEQIMRQRTLPSELSSLAAKFQNLSHREEREDFVIDLANEHPHLDENAKAAIKQYLATYEKKREAPSADVAGMLSDSLLAALGDKTKEHEDRKLFKLMAAVEQRSEAGTLQAAQKFGQQFAWIGAGTGSVLVARSLFTFAAQAIIAREDIREYRYGRDEDALAALAGRLLATKVTGNLMAIVSSLISLGLGYAYHEYILCKNVQRGASGSNLSVVNTPAPSLFKALPQEFLAFLRYPDARVEEVTDYSTLAGRQVPEADRPPKMKFTRQIKLTEATWEQMFSADLAPPADLGPWGKLKDVWETWSGYFTEEHGSLAEMTESQLAVAIKKDLDKVMHYLKQEQEEEEEDQSVSPTQEARINTSKKEHLDGAAPTRIDDDEHPLIPLHIPLISMPRFEPVNTPRTPRTGMPSLPTTPRTQASQPPKSPPTTPRNQASSTQKTGTIRPLEYRSQGRQNELTRRIARGKAISVTKVPGGGESVIERVQLDADPSDILRFDTHNDLPPSADNAPPVENYFVTQPQLGNPSPAMQKLHWKPLERSQALEQGDGPKAIFMATTSSYAYFSHNPIGTNAIRAYGVPRDSQSIFHICSDKYPTLDATNMLQMRLSGNEGWGTLASTIDFAMFVNDHLAPGARPADRASRIANKHFDDLALFSQQMALERPDQSWSPLTSAGGIYAAEDPMPLQYNGIPPTLIKPAAFAVQYTGRDWDGQPVTNAAMLTLDETGFYIAVDPKRDTHLLLGVEDADKALRQFMEIAAKDHAIESFNVLHHVGGAMKDGTSERVRAVILVGHAAGGADAAADAIVAALISEDRTIGAAIEWIEWARHTLEAEKTYYLTELNSPGNHSTAKSAMNEIDGHFRTLEAAYAAAKNYKKQSSKGK